MSVRFIEELKRRKVLATAGVYLVASFVTMQAVDAIFQFLPFENTEAAVLPNGTVCPGRRWTKARAGRRGG